ncbi:MAG TPA: ferritin-like domain-containing protein [Myxococcota bacterium]|nr:ferritin-like domain-containing protein [Myxococcota bacterium]
MDPSQFTSESLLASTFRDDYALEHEKLESLYSKAKRHQWNAELDVDWGRFEPDAFVLDPEADFLSRLVCVQELPEAERKRLYRAANLFLISQVLHGEQAALMTCGQLVNAVPDMDGKFAAASQVIDEARHVEVFARYLQCHGKRFPMDPDLRSIVQQLLSETDWEAKCVGMQVILESIALSFFRLGEEMAVEPVLQQFIGRVHEDEARHVAYGVLTLEDRIPELAEATRERLENWAYDAIARIGGRAGKPAFSSQLQALAETGIDLGTFLPKLLAELAHPEKLDLSGLRDPMAQTVLPNLLRIGLVPERLVPGYLAQGWRIDLDARSVDDIHTFADETRAVRAELREQGIDFADPKQVSGASL